jgi:multidrug resistance efflux pump
MENIATSAGSSIILLPCVNPEGNIIKVLQKSKHRMMIMTLIAQYLTCLLTVLNQV